MNKPTLATLVPAYLWIGNHNDLLQSVIAWLQTLLCPHQGCNHCSTCLALRQQQHHATTWLYPDKTYTLEHLEVIHSTMAFSLENGQHHFFIIQRADFLTPTCSNSLLKSIEEPTAGYHFILLASQLNAMLPTVRSRCVIESFIAPVDQIPFPELYAFFTDIKQSQPFEFLKKLEQSSINEHESQELINHILAYWCSHYKSAIKNNDHINTTKSSALIDVITQAITKPPMPGSSAIFWKNLYLQLNQ